MDVTEKLVRLILDTHPDTQAIYLYGSSGTEHERPESDLDLALLLPPEQAKQAGSLVMGDLHLALERASGKDMDLINLRRVSTVFQHEIVTTGIRIYCGDAYAADEFEMLVMSLYQKLNQERAGIIKAGLESGRFFDV